MVRDRDAAADLVQESYTRVLALRDTGQEVSEPRALLYQTARRLIIDRHRRQALRQHEDIDDLAESDQTAAPSHLEPESVYAQEQHARAFVAVISSLNQTNVMLYQGAPVFLQHYSSQFLIDVTGAFGGTRCNLSVITQ